MYTQAAGAGRDDMDTPRYHTALIVGAGAFCLGTTNVRGIIERGGR